MDRLAQELQQIPEANYLVLRRLFHFLFKVARNEDSNKMTPDNLGKLIDKAITHQNKYRNRFWTDAQIAHQFDCYDGVLL